jgi:hypothetical protein
MRKHSFFRQLQEPQHQHCVSKHVAPPCDLQACLSCKPSFCSLRKKLANSPDARRPNPKAALTNPHPRLVVSLAQFVSGPRVRVLQSRLLNLGWAGRHTRRPPMVEQTGNGKSCSQ